MSEPFVFKSCALVNVATGISVQSIAELHAAIDGVPSRSLYFHLWSGLLRHRLDPQEYRNGFATWTVHGPQDVVLAERLSTFDPLDYNDDRAMRADLKARLRERLDERGDDGPSGQAFQFIVPQVVVYDTPHRAASPQELLDCLARVPLSSVYYHFIEARLRAVDREARLGAAGGALAVSGADDFSAWLGAWDEPGRIAARDLRALFPSFFTLHELRDRVIATIAAAFELPAPLPGDDRPYRIEAVPAAAAARALREPADASEPWHEPRPLDAYREILGENRLMQLEQLGRRLRGKRVVHVNSTRVGGGVAELLGSLVPLQRGLGIDARWEVMAGSAEFFAVTKSIHNALQGQPLDLSAADIRCYEETVRAAAEDLAPRLADADVVIIHDPQPAFLRRCMPRRRGAWIWRCHIDLSRPHPPVWDYLREIVAGYDASLFSLIDFAQTLPHSQVLAPPGIDPLAIKNVALPDAELTAVRERFDLPADRPLIMQVSRYDRHKDPLGVLRAARLAKRVHPRLLLVLCGGEADDDPEGQAVLAEVHEAVGDDPDVRVLLLGADEIQRTTNALQWLPDAMLQKSIHEGFGLTVTEAMWKARPVIGGAVGGIRLQVRNHRTGFVVHSPEGAAQRLSHLLTHPELGAQLGQAGRQFVRENFLITRLLRDHLNLYAALLTPQGGHLQVGTA